MKLPRRQFLKTTTAAFLGGSAMGRDVMPGGLAEVLSASGFQAGQPGNALLAVVADLHIDMNASTMLKTFDNSLVAELNAFGGLTDLVLAGDIITSHSNAAGQPRYATAYANAKEEFRLAKNEIARFSSAFRTWAVPGNHDTDNQEVTPDLWNQQLGIPSNRRLDLGGVPVFLLNSGHAGTLDAAQRSWFFSQVAEIPRTQEVVIVAHHPSLFYMVGETGLKKIVTTAFAGWQAPIYLIGGHGHANAHSITRHRGTTFIQMQITCGTRTQWNDGNAPGYALVAMAGGKVLSRIYRSVFRNTHQVAPGPQLVPPTRLAWPFDLVPFPAQTWETDGNRQTLVSHVSNDLKTHLAYVGSMEWNFNTLPYGGKVREFLLLASISRSILSSCKVSFAAAGANPVWVDQAVPEADQGQVHRISIPAALRSLPTLRVRFSTTVPRYGGSITVGGWGFASSYDALTGYERWCATHYRTFLATPETAPDRIPPGQQKTNLELFAFNQPVPEVAAPGLWLAAGGSSSMIPEPPSMTFEPEKVVDYVFQRRTLPQKSGLRYVAQASRTLRQWDDVPESGLLIEKMATEGWERVTVRRTVMPGQTWYFRVSVEPIAGGGGEYPQWLARLPSNPSRPQDRNSNGRLDLFEFAFDPEQSVNPIRTNLLSGGEAAAEVFTMPTPYPRTTKLPVLRFTRMKESARPGVRYILESSENLQDWSDWPVGLQAERQVQADGDYETVEIICLDPRSDQRYFRIRVETPGS